MWKFLFGLAAAVMVSAAACYQPWFKIEQYPSMAEIQPPPEYAVWWENMEECTHRHGDMRRVHFIVVQANRLLGDRGFRAEGDADSLLGLYDPGVHRIYVTQPGMFTEWLVSHEMVHALGIMGHPDSIFKTACGLPT